jgi:hypothetical protein
MNHRPYPRRGRALAQVERGRVPDPPLCPICAHPVLRHALEDGQRVCSLGEGTVACRACAELEARSPAMAGFLNFGMLWRSGAGRWALVEQPRQAGKTAIVTPITQQAVKADEVVQVATGLTGGAEVSGE